MKIKSAKIKVCHLTSVHPPKDGRIFYKECTSLAKAGYDVTLIVANADDEECNGVHIVGVRKAKGGRINRFIKTGRDVYKKALAIDADIYHIHDPELLPYALKLKNRGKKVIFDSHEFTGEQIKTKPYLPSILRSSVSYIYRTIETYICKRIDCVIQVCTLDGKNYFENKCKRSIFITNASILSNGECPQLPLEKRLNTVVLVGSLTEDRGITKLAEAIVKTPCKLILAGSFSSPEYEEYIKDICGEHLDYRGFIPANKIASLLNECGIGISIFSNVGQYARADTLPTKSYDYMYAGLPMIMSDLPYLMKFNEKYQVGVNVDSDEPQEIADAINYLSTHPGEALKLGENGYQLLRNSLNWGIEEKKLLELYASLA